MIVMRGVVGVPAPLDSGTKQLIPHWASVWSGVPRAVPAAGTSPGHPVQPAVIAVANPVMQGLTGSIAGAALLGLVPLATFAPLDSSLLPVGFTARRILPVVHRVMAVRLGSSGQAVLF